MKEQRGIRGAAGFVKKVFQEFGEDRCLSQSAAIAYYTAFALPPLLVFILLLLGLVLDEEQARGLLTGQARAVVGREVGAQVQAMIENAEKVQAGSSALAVVVGIGALVFSASGAFLSLQEGLNNAWEVRPDPRRGGIRSFLFKRLLSLGLVLTIAFLLLISLVISGLLSAFGHLLSAFLPGGLSGALLQGLNWLLSFGVLTGLFALMFRVLPDAEVAWEDVWVGALFTALLFTVGKSLIGLYLGRSNPGSVFGAAGSFALILIWIYYSAVILLLGAEFTQVRAGRRGKTVRPEPGAVRVRTEILPEAER